MKKNKNKNIIKIKDLLSNQKGMALLTTLIFVFILVTFAVALLTMTGNDTKLSTLQRESTRAFYLAETGIEKAIWYLNSSEDNPDGLYFVGPLHGGSAIEFYDVDISDIDTTGPYETKTLVSTAKVLGGEYSKGTRIVEVKLKKGVKSSEGAVYNYGLMTFSEDSNLEFNGHVKIEGDVHSNGDITGNGWDPDNDVIGDVTYAGDSNVTGTYVEDIDTPQDFPTISWDYYKTHADKIYDTQTVYEIGDETLTGIHYFIGDVIIKNDLNVYGTIVVDGNISVGGHPEINLEENGVISLVMVASGDITLGGNVNVEGIIHTEGKITLNGNTTVDKGAILAADGVVNGKAAKTKIVYASDYQDKPVLGTGVPVWVKISWQEVY